MGKKRKSINAHVSRHEEDTAGDKGNPKIFRVEISEPISGNWLQKTIQDVFDKIKFCPKCDADMAELEKIFLCNRISCRHDIKKSGEKI